MTQRENFATPPQLPAQPSLDGIVAAADLARVRIRPAEFARALGVSKQSVSRWVRDGWVTLAADGRLDPVVAVSQLLRRCDPGRLRARWLRQAVADVQTLRDAAADADQRADAAEADLQHARERIAYLENFADAAEAWHEMHKRLMLEREADLRATSSPAEWSALVDRLDDLAAELTDPAVDDALDTLRAIHETEGGRGEVG